MTPHNEAKKEEIAKTVLMPGDPYRAKYIAENFLDDYKLVNQVRGMLTYTGTYKGKRVTIMPSGMGTASMGIYSYELFKFYDVDNIIRIGSAGAYTDKLHLYDIILANGAYSESSFGETQNGDTHHIKYGSKKLNNQIKAAGKKNDIKVHFENIHSSDVFYKERDNFKELYDKYGCAIVEMEAFALFHNAKVLGKNAACICTISDSLVTHEETTPEERQNGLGQMIKLALESVE